MIEEVDAGDEAEEALAIDDNGNQAPVEQRQEPLGRLVRLYGHKVARHRAPYRQAEIELAFRECDQDVGLVEKANAAMPVKHGHLRNIVKLHAAIRGLQCIFGADGDNGTFIVKAGNEVAQIAKDWPLQQPLLRHPAVVEHLGEVLVAGIADEGNDALRLRLLAAIPQRRREQRP